MKRSTKDVTFRERFLGITVLVVVQLIVGIIHVIFGFNLLSGGFSVVSYSMIPMMYTFYTLSYGLLTLFFTYLIWLGKRSGWIGTVAVSLFVIIVDILAVLDLSNVLGIPAPKVAAIGEIPFGILILVYLLQYHVRSKYGI
ncbi:hypothetical protein ACFLRN_00080 [Thermoproteota archaeon]